MPKHATNQQRVTYGAKKRKRGPNVIGILLFALVALLVASAAIVVFVRPAPAIDFLGRFGITVPVLIPGPTGGNNAQDASSSAKGATASQQVTPDDGRRVSNAKDFTTLGDRGLTSDEEAEQRQAQKRLQQTPLIARCEGVDLRLSVPMADLTGILFHQASYGYALPLETEVPAADYETIADTRSFFINHEQTPADGEWAQTEVLYIWRTTDTTDVNTSIDIGAQPGTTVKSPVDGTVVLVRNYLLYEEMEDVEIHIQPTGRPDLDCVLIHISDPQVKAGDKVEAGITNIARSRDIETFLTDVQLGFFTPEGVGGNHVHVQVNDANYPEYRAKKLEGAITPQA